MGLTGSVRVIGLIEVISGLSVPLRVSMNRGQDKIENRNSGTWPEFWFRLMRNRNDFSKFWFQWIRNRIGDLKIRFRLIRTGLRQIRSGKKDKQINRPVCAYTAVVNNIRHVCIH